MLCQTGWSKTSWDAQHGWSFGESCMKMLPTSVPKHPEKRDYTDGGSEKEFLFSTFVEEWPQPYKEQIPLCSRGTGECGGWQRPRGGDWRLLVLPLWAHHIRGDGWMWGLCQPAELCGCQTPHLWEPCVCGRGCYSEPLCAAESLPQGFSVLIYAGLSCLSLLHEMVFHIQEERGLLCTRYPKETPVFKCHSL